METPKNGLRDRQNRPTFTALRDCPRRSGRPLDLGICGWFAYRKGGPKCFPFRLHDQYSLTTVS
jgi:hypothetical protein